MQAKEACRARHFELVCICTFAENGFGVNGCFNRSVQEIMTARNARWESVASGSGRKSDDVHAVSGSPFTIGNG